MLFIFMLLHYVKVLVCLPNVYFLEYCVYVFVFFLCSFALKSCSENDRELVIAQVVIDHSLLQSISNQASRHEEVTNMK